MGKHRVKMPARTLISVAKPVLEVMLLKHLVQSLVLEVDLGYERSRHNWGH